MDTRLPISLGNSPINLQQKLELMKTKPIKRLFLNPKTPTKKNYQKLPDSLGSMLDITQNLFRIAITPADNRSPIVFTFIARIHSKETPKEKKSADYIHHEVKDQSSDSDDSIALNTNKNQQIFPDSITNIIEKPQKVIRKQTRSQTLIVKVKDCHKVRLQPRSHSKHPKSNASSLKIFKKQTIPRKNGTHVSRFQSMKNKLHPLKRKNNTSFKFN